MFFVSRKYDVIHSQRRDNDRERLVGDLQTEGRLWRELADRAHRLGSNLVQITHQVRLIQSP